MNKITVFKTDSYDANVFWNEYYKNGQETMRAAINKAIQSAVKPNSVEITDEEMVDASREYAKLCFPYPDQVGQRAHIRDAYMAAYEFIKNQINQKR